MRVAPAICVVVMLLGTQLHAATPSKPSGSPKAPPQCCGAASSQPSTPDLRGTAKQPLVVNATLPPKSEDEIKNEKDDRAARYKMDVWTIRIGATTLVVLVLQMAAFMLQAHRLKQSVDEMQAATLATQQAARAEQQTVETMN